MRSIKILAAVVLVLGTMFVMNVPTADARPAARGYVGGRSYAYSAGPYRSYGYTVGPNRTYGYYSGPRGYAYGYRPGYNGAYYGNYYRPGYAYGYYRPWYGYGYAYRPYGVYGRGYGGYGYGGSGYAQSYSSPSTQVYADTPRRNVVTMELRDNMFDPDTIQISAGTTVRWVNRGRNMHTVTSEDNRWTSGELAPGQSFSLRFSHVGTYHIFCEHHQGMVGTLIVDDGGAVNY